MNNHQSIVDDLRIALDNEGILFLTGVEPTAEFLDLVAQYRSFCQDCNRRLRKCDDALKKGLRSEALHEAEETPNLLDLVAALDFPEREQLGEILSAHQLPKPDSLMMDIAEALNEAYAIQEPLQALMTQHRLLALARSPLPMRLNVLRKLADHDNTTIHWDQDILEMERTRFAEIEQLTQSALKERNYGLLKELHQEVTGTIWREPPPESLLLTIKRSGSQVIRQNAIQQLQELAPRLHDAFAALDVTAARQLREKWTKAAEASSVSANDRLLQEVEPIFHWLSDQDRKESSEKSLRHAISALERGVEDDGLGASELMGLGNDVQKHGTNLPEHLAIRYRNRLSALQLSESRRSRAIQLAIVSVVVLFGVLIGYAVYSTNRAEENEQILATITKFIDDHNYGEARSLFDQHAARATTEDWLAVKSQLVDAEHKENERLLELKSLLESIDDEIPPAQAVATLERARPLAWSTEEKLQIGNLEDSWRKKKNEHIAALETEFRALIKSATDEIVQLEGLLANDAVDQELDHQMNEVVTHLSATSDKKRGVSKELSNQVAFLESRLTAFREKRDKKRERMILLETITDAAFLNLSESSAPEKIKKYEDVLKRFDSEYATDSLTSGFRTAGRQNALPHVRAKVEMVGKWPKTLIPDTVDDLSRRVQDCHEFLKEHSRSPECDSIRQYLAVLNSIRRRDIPDEKATIPVRQSLAKLYDMPMIGSGHVLTTKDGLTFYLPEKSRLNEGVNTFSFFNSLDGSRRKLDKSLKADVFQSLTTTSPPQVEITANVAADVRNLNMKNWSEFHLKLIQDLLKSTSIDPFLKYYLVLRTAKYAGLGDSILEEELNGIIVELREDQIDLSAAWMDPYDENANKIRKHVVEILADIKPEMFDDVSKNYSSQQTLLEDLLFAHPSSVGWISKELNGTWIFHSRWRPDREYLLYCALPVEDKQPDSPLAWQRIGRAGTQGVIVNRTNYNGLTDGTVVFASRFPLNSQP